MISNPNLVFYACIATGRTILAEFSREAGIETLAQKCVDVAPPHHAMFSHTACKRTYMFLIDNPFVYFSICDQNLEKSESFWFLNRVKTAFEEFNLSNPIKDFDKLSSLSFQGQFYPLFREIMAMDVEECRMMMGEVKGSRASSVDSTKGARGMVAARPLLAKPTKLFMKKKKRLCGEANGVVHHVKDGVDKKVNNVGENGDFSVSMVQKNGGFYVGDSRQKAKQIWRKHVWVVLILDLVVCAVLFGIWLWVCRGFKCIDG